MKQIFATVDDQKKVAIEIEKKVIDKSGEISSYIYRSEISLSDVYSDVDDVSLNRKDETDPNRQLAQIKDFDITDNICCITSNNDLDNISFIVRDTTDALSPTLKYVDVKTLFKNSNLCTDNVSLNTTDDISVIQIKDFDNISNKKTIKTAGDISNLSSVQFVTRNTTDTNPDNFKLEYYEMKPFFDNMIEVSAIAHQLSDDSPYIRKIQVGVTEGLWGFSYQTSEKNRFDEYVWEDVRLSDVVYSIGITDLSVGESGKVQKLKVTRTSGITDSLDIIHPSLTQSEISDINSHCSCWMDCPRAAQDYVMRIAGLSSKLYYFTSDDPDYPNLVENYDYDLSVEALSNNLHDLYQEVDRISSSTLLINCHDGIIAVDPAKYNPGINATIDIQLDKSIFVAGDNMTIVTSDNEIKFSADDITVSDSGSTFIDASCVDNIITVKTKESPSLNTLSVNSLSCNSLCSTTDITTCNLTSTMNAKFANTEVDNLTINNEMTCDVNTSGKITSGSGIECTGIDGIKVTSGNIEGMLIKSSGNIESEMDIIASGNIKANGTVECNELSVNNDVSFKGINCESIYAVREIIAIENITTTNLTTSGNIKTNGTVECNDLNIATGTATVYDIKATNLSFENTLTCNVNTSGNIKAFGKIKSEQTIEANNIEATELNIKGNSITINEKTYVPTEIEIPKVTLSEGVYVISGIEKMTVLKQI